MSLTGHRVSAALVLLAGAGLLIFGIYLLWSPIAGLAQFGLVLPDDALHRIEMRAFYGGIEIGIGALMIKFALNAQYRRAGLWLVLASYGGVGFMRLTAMMAEGQYPRLMLVALAIEALLAILAAVMLTRQKSPAPG